MFISLHIGVYKLDNMCAALDIAKRTYYKYRNTQDRDYYDYRVNKGLRDSRAYLIGLGLAVELLAQEDNDVLDVYVGIGADLLDVYFSLDLLQLLA